MKETPAGIEQVLRKIVARYFNEEWINERYADGLVHALLNSEEVVIKEKGPAKYGCHCDLDVHQKADGCLIDEGKSHDCFYAQRVTKKEDCEFWQPIKED